MGANPGPRGREGVSLGTLDPTGDLSRRAGRAGMRCKRRGLTASSLRGKLWFGVPWELLICACSDMVRMERRRGKGGWREGCLSSTALQSSLRGRTATRDGRPHASAPYEGIPSGENPRNSKVRLWRCIYPRIAQGNIRTANWTAGGGRASLPSVPPADGGGEADKRMLMHVRWALGRAVTDVEKVSSCS